MLETNKKENSLSFTQVYAELVLKVNVSAAIHPVSLLVFVSGALLYGAELLA